MGIEIEWNVSFLHRGSWSRKGVDKRSVKGLMVNIFSFAGQTASVTSIPFCPISQKQPQTIQKQMGRVSSVQFSHSVVSNSLRPHGLQHARPPCPSPTPEVYSNSCPLSQWCHPIISSSVVPFSCLQSYPESRYFQMSQFFASGGQSIRASASTSVLPMNTQDWFPLGWTGWISLGRAVFQ